MYPMFIAEPHHADWQLEYAKSPNRRQSEEPSFPRGGVQDSMTLVTIPI
jgi:hypothetical protein